MNDPHVVALHHNIDHHPLIAFDKAKPLDHRETAFDVSVEDKKARFTFKEHHATAEAARAAVEELIRARKFDADPPAALFHYSRDHVHGNIDAASSGDLHDPGHRERRPTRSSKHG